MPRWPPSDSNDAEVSKEGRRIAEANRQCSSKSVQIRHRGGHTRCRPLGERYREHVVRNLERRAHLFGIALVDPITPVAGVSWDRACLRRQRIPMGCRFIDPHRTEHAVVAMWHVFGESKAGTIRGPIGRRARVSFPTSG